MSFDARIIGFAERFLSDRTFQLIVAPAVADLQFEHCERPLRRTANRVAVLRAVAGGLRDDLARVSGGMLALMLLPACYYIFLLVICFDVFSISMSTDFVVVAMLILVLSFGPVMACFWPEGQSARPVD
jgi:Mn2+/Fe2+ NRAMP family transporter